MFHYRLTSKSGQVLDIIAPTVRQAIVIGYRALGVIGNVKRASYVRQ